MLTGLRAKLILAALFVCSPVCQAQTWSLPLFTSDPHAVITAAANYKIPEDVPAAVLERSVSVQIDEQGKMQRTTRTVTKVLRVQAIDFVQRMSIPWSLVRDMRPSVKARVITSDGQAHSLEQANVAERDPQDQNAVGLYKTLWFGVPDVDIDSVVELEVVEGDKEPAMPGVRFGVVDVPRGLPIFHFQATITSLGPSDLHVETRSFAAAKVSTVPAGKGHGFSVEARQFQPQSIGNFLPSDVAPFPMVVFTNVPSWQSVARWYSGVMQKSVVASPTARSASSADLLQATEKAYEEVRQQLKDNGLDPLLTIPPTRSPADIVKSGTGDSRDEAIVLINKLAELGIAAKFALISANPQPDVLPNMPGVDAFNHVLVYVPGTSPLWIDPSAEFTPVSQLPLTSQNRWALVIDPSTTQLVRTSASTDKDNWQKSAMDIRVGDGVPTTTSDRMEAGGVFSASLRSLINQLEETAEAQRPLAVTPLFRRAGGETVESVKHSDAHHLLEPAWMEVTGSGYSPAGLTDDAGFIDLPGFAHFNFQSVTPLLGAKQDDQPFTKGRTVDYEVIPAFTTEYSFHVVPPLGYSLKEMAPIAPVTLGPLSILTSTNLEKDGSFRLQYTLTLTKTRLTPQEVESMRNGSRKFSDQDFRRVQYENVAMAKMNAGDFAAGLQLLKKDSEAAKETINPTLRLAAGYVRVGARDAGAKICEDLLKASATNAAGANSASSDSAVVATHSRLGWIYEHDQFGRAMAPGMNAAEAEKNLKAAAEAGDNDALLELANLYTFNAAGLRFGRGSRLENAAAILNRIDLNVLARSGRLNEYALVLLRARKYPQVHELFLLPQADAADQSIRWAAFAASRTDSDLKQEIEFRVDNPAQRRILLVEAGRQLIATRDYAGAARAFRLAGPGPGISAADLDRLSRVRIFDDGSASKDLPVAAFQRYIEALLNPETADEWKKFAAAEIQSGSTLQEQRNLIMPQFANFMPGVARQEFWPYVADVVNTTVVLSAEGSDADGFRIKVSAGGTGPVTTVGYVIKQDKDYVVAGPINSEAVPMQVVRFARAGNMKAARQWLDWGRQAVNRPNVSDADFNQVLDTISGQELVREGKAQDAAVSLERAHQQNPSDRGTTYLLADSLIRSNRTAEAGAFIDQLSSSDPNSLLVLRLRAHLLSQQRNYPEAVTVDKQICANSNATAGDWNDLAWITLFTGQNSPDALSAAQKAAQMTNSRNAAILHTLALAQATAGHLKDAIATGYKLDDLSGDQGELQTLFGRIAEQLGLNDTAKAYYSAVPAENNSALSNYSFAQFRLAGLKANTKAVANPAE